MGNAMGVPYQGLKSLSLLPREIKVTQLLMDDGSKVYVYLACNSEKGPKE